MKDYTTAVEEIYSILNAAWDNPSSGARAVTLAVTGEEWGYIPLLLQPGKEFRPSSTDIYGKANYQTVTSGKLPGEEKYKNSGMLGVHIRCPRSDATSTKIARSLAQVVQGAFRTASSDWITFSDEKIIEVGLLNGKYQINVFVICKFETDI
jgi:hypothetical protein